MGVVKGHTRSLELHPEWVQGLQVQEPKSGTSALLPEFRV